MGIPLDSFGLFTILSAALYYFCYFDSLHFYLVGQPLWCKYCNHLSYVPVLFYFCTYEYMDVISMLELCVLATDHGTSTVHTNTRGLQVFKTRGPIGLIFAYKFQRLQRTIFRHCFRTTINWAKQVTSLIIFGPIILNYYCMLIYIQVNLNSCFKFIVISNSII